MRTSEQNNNDLRNFHTRFSDDYYYYNRSIRVLLFNIHARRFISYIHIFKAFPFRISDRLTLIVKTDQATSLSGPKHHGNTHRIRRVHSHGNFFNTDHAIDSATVGMRELVNKSVRFAMTVFLRHGLEGWGKNRPGCAFIFRRISVLNRPRRSTIVQNNSPKKGNF